MSLTTALRGEIADLKIQVLELQNTLELHKKTAQRLCDTIIKNDGKPHGDAFVVGVAWSTAAYISGEKGPAPWEKRVKS